MSNNPGHTVIKSELSANAPVFVPRGFHPVPQPQPQYHQQGMMVPYQDPLVQVQEAITFLTGNPGSFDDILPPLTQSLNMNIINEEMLLGVVEALFSQAISEPNFRYTAARMCNEFSNYLTVTVPTGNFYQHLLSRCHKEHVKQSQQATGGDSGERLSGFTMFMGELLRNLKIVQAVDEQKMTTLLSKATLELLGTLLSLSSEANIKCISQVLKLAGAVLEKSEKACNEGATPLLDHIMASMKQIMVDEKTSKSVRANLLSCIELRAKKWGEKEVASPAPNNTQSTSAVNHPINSAGDVLQCQQQIYPVSEPMYHHPHDDTVFYRNAQPVPFEEVAQYYPEYYSNEYDEGAAEWSQQQDMYGYMYTDGSEHRINSVPSEDGMDDEMEAAFEEFVRESELKRNYQT